MLAFALVVALQRWNTGEFAITPGNATPVAPLITVHGVATNPHPDTVMLTDVYLESLSVWSWITAHFESHVQLVSGSELVAPGQSLSELDAQGFLEMYDAKRAAEVVAFRTLGWSVPARATGTVITGVQSPSPAATAGLGVGDEVVGAGARSIRSACQLIGYLHDVVPGTSVRVRVRHVRISNSGALTWRAPTVVTVKTARVPAGVAPSGCPGISGADRSFLGVSLEDGFDYRLPARVSIDTANIGGPSAGLALTLGLIATLGRGSITGHHVVAATGTMDVTGAVGDVGGVAEKTVAVQRAGAQYFIVPQVEVATARAAATPGLTVFGVTTLAQALADLRSLGGVRPSALTGAG